MQDVREIKLIIHFYENYNNIHNNIISKIITFFLIINSRKGAIVYYFFYRVSLYNIHIKALRSMRQSN